MTTVRPADQARAYSLLQHALRMTGMSPESVSAMSKAALAVGAVDSGASLASAAVVASTQSADPAQQATDTATTPPTSPGAERTIDGGGGPVPLTLVGSAARAQGPAARASAEDHLAQARGLLSVIEGVTQAAARLDAALVLAARQQTTAIGRSLLAERDISSPDDLGVSQRVRWRARAKALSRHEIEAATGWGPGEVVDLVGLATAPVEAAQPAIEAMASGLAPWRLARSFWRDCGALGTDEAAHVAGAMFGTDPDTCAPERLDPDGAMSDAPWFHREFRSALRREVTRIRSTDLAAARAAREAALTSRAMGVTIDENGTGTVTLIGSALQATAVADRIDQAARRARSAGDERTLTQLRTDIGLALMLHGTVLPPDSARPIDAGDANPTTTDAGLEWTPELAQVLSGMPSATLQVVVPVAALHSGSLATLPTPPTDPSPMPTGGAPTLASRAPTPTLASRAPTPTPTPTPTSKVPPAPLTPGGDPLLVGQVLGAHPAFISLDLIHDLAVLPGTVLERLLVDPADGRCIERSIDRYRPDAAMRTQIMAADVTCRAPGCMVRAAACQLDHVVEHGTPGGVTAETNLAPLHVGHHHPKTLKAWDSSLSANRDMTWTSLLGRLYRTRSHDYRQYVTLLTDALDRTHASTLDHPREAHGRATSDELHQIDREILLALAFRAGDESLQAGDDTLEPDTMRFGGWGFVSLTHTDDRGIRRSGPSGALLAERAAAQSVSQGQPDTVTPPGPDETSTSDRSQDVRTDDTEDRRHRSAERLRRDEGPPPF